MAFLDTLKSFGKNFTPSGFKQNVGNVAKTAAPSFFQPRNQTTDPSLLIKQNIVGQGGIKIGGASGPEFAPGGQGLRKITQSGVSAFSSAVRSAKPKSQTSSAGNIKFPKAGQTPVSRFSNVKFKPGGQTKLPTGAPKGVPKAAPRVSTPSVTVPTAPIPGFPSPFTPSTPTPSNFTPAPQNFTPDPTLNAGPSTPAPTFSQDPTLPSGDPGFSVFDNPIVDPITGETVFGEQGLAQAGGQGQGGTSNFRTPATSGGVPARSSGTGTLSAASGLSTPQGILPSEQDEPISTRELLKVPGTDNPIDISVFDPKTRQNVRQFLTTPEALSPNDLQSTLGGLRETATGLAFQLAQAQGFPTDPTTGAPNGVIDSPEQSEFLLTFPENERSDLQSQLDEVKQSLGMPGLLQQRTELQTNINAITDIYSQAIEDIRSNPDLPKGLAARRISTIAGEQNRALQALLNQLEITEQQLDDINDEVDNRFGIIKFQADEANRTADNNRQTLQMLITSGAVAGFQDSDISQWAAATGVPEAGLKSLKAAASQPDVRIEGNARDGFYKVTQGSNGVVNVDRLTEPARSETTPTGPEAPDVLDIQRLVGLYPNAGIVFGDSKDVIEQKITNANKNVALIDLQDDVNNGVTDFSQLAQAYPELNNNDITDVLLAAGINQTDAPGLQQEEPGLFGGFFGNIFKR